MTNATYTYVSLVQRPKAPVDGVRTFSKELRLR
jgi:hypothetical protein